MWPRWPALLEERLGRGTIVALVGATAGLAWLAGPTVQAAGLDGLAVSMVAAASFVALIVLSKPLASAYGGLRLAFVELAGAGLGLVLVPAAVATAWPAPSAAWLWLVVLGLVHTAVGIGPPWPAGCWSSPRGMPGGRGRPANQGRASGSARPGARRWFDQGCTTVAQVNQLAVQLASSSSGDLLGGTDLLRLLVLAFGGALVVGNGLALVRSRASRVPAQTGEDDQVTPPLGRSMAMIGIGLVAAVWAIASLTT